MPKYVQLHVPVKIGSQRQSSASLVRIILKQMFRYIINTPIKLIREERYYTIEFR